MATSRVELKKPLSRASSRAPRDAEGLAQARLISKRAEFQMSFLRVERRTVREQLDSFAALGHNEDKEAG
ncbi:unnamed protein product [Linum trigynum]|uniref:Uncharacterized protein n=1 Tax=Linum trigynum TaxID=586398 RepID=A0AAV2E5K9_9ROSI